MLNDAEDLLRHYGFMKMDANAQPMTEEKQYALMDSVAKYLLINHNISTSF